MILVHNHPSGTAQPSRADEALTQTLKTALALVDTPGAGSLHRHEREGGFHGGDGPCLTQGLRPFFASLWVRGLSSMHFWQKNRAARTCTTVYKHGSNVV